MFGLSHSKRLFVTYMLGLSLYVDSKSIKPLVNRVAGHHEF